MDLVEFHQALCSDQKPQAIDKFFDQSICLYSLLDTNYSKDLDIKIHEKKNDCNFEIIPNHDNIDISYMEQMLTGLEVNYFSHRFVVSATKSDKGIIIHLAE